MDREIEKLIIKTFFLKNRQERSLYELSTKKRRQFLYNLSNYHTLIDKKYMIEIPKPNSNYLETLKLLKKYGAQDNAYSISLSEKIDGRHLPLEEALKHAVGMGMASIVSCIQEKLAYLEGEQSKGAPLRYILYKE